MTSSVKSLRHRVEYCALRALVCALGSVSWERAGRIGAGVGAFGFRPLGIRRRVVERQIAAAFPVEQHYNWERVARDTREFAREVVQS